MIKEYEDQSPEELEQFMMSQRRLICTVADETSPQDDVVLIC